jgi:hypothetical protein
MDELDVNPIESQRLHEQKVHRLFHGCVNWLDEPKSASCVSLMCNWLEQSIKCFVCFIDALKCIVCFIDMV